MSHQLHSVAQAMTRDPFVLQSDDTLDLLEELMENNRIRHVPVLDGDELVGVVSQRDLSASALSAALDYDDEPRSAFLRTLQIEQVMSHDVVHVRPETTLAGAAELLIKHEIGCLPVVDEERRLVGLLSEVDLVRAAYLPPGDGRARVDEGSRSKWRELARQELEELQSLREEVGLQASLGRSEARDQWEKVEARFVRAAARLEALKDDASEEAQALAQRLVRRLGDDYRRLAKLMTVT